MLSKILNHTASRSLIRSTIITPAVLSTAAIRYYSVPPSKFAFKAGPPRLPKEEQEEFEKLQQIANSQIAIEEFNDQVNQANAAEQHREHHEFNNSKPPVVNTDIGTFSSLKIIPEFEGNVNPRTGERGGPKQDPLKHTKDEWSFNGRVIDF
ncbi:Succinate dehydrogenase assembly factor 4, mitochondrial [Candida viswanathii]|uniref:Succinate dehydrogenase assembly factor 4, mitochondrial n=1 Tax=Candida viswanathii TaxID=5486 RepID=A0A367YNZ0_9ASCO|nr:Succinate dehydrogenase assembly factor 4, mitochondrial [Candida viswanathii]